jgi:arsenate reductase-like glutaredoxin family protein
MTTVRIRHVRQANLCASGTRAWFERHNINYPDFLKNGIDAEAILALGDHFGNVVVSKAKEEEAKLKEASNG